MVVRSRTDVKAGHRLTISYVPLNVPLLLRQRKLREEKYFRCRCPRCLDSGEADSELGAVSCRCGGLLRPPLDPDYDLSPSMKGVSDDGDFQCRDCGAKLSVGSAASLMERALADCEEAAAATALFRESNLERLRELCKHFSGVMVPVFARYLYDVRLGIFLTRLWRFGDAPLHTCPKEVALEVEDTLSRALPVAQRILPGTDPELCDILGALGKARVILLRFCGPANRMPALQEAARNISEAEKQARRCFGEDCPKRNELQKLAVFLREKLPGKV